MHYYVSPDGADSNPGTEPRPFATLGKACDILGPGDTCWLREGVYREVLRPVRSGKSDKTITFSGYPGERAIISAADPLARWEYAGDGIYSTRMPWSLGDANQMFYGENMQPEACWPAPGRDPLFRPRRAKVEMGDDHTLVCPAIPTVHDNWEGAKLWCAGGQGWICWTRTVLAHDPETHTITFAEGQKKWYKPRKGSLFCLRGHRGALRKPGQWLYDAAAQKMFVIPLDGLKPIDGNWAAKRRKDVADLSGLSHIHIRDISCLGGGIRTDAATKHVVLDGMTARYVAHDYTRDVSQTDGIMLMGHHILAVNCDFGYSSGSILTVGGTDNRVINCHLHHGGYAGLWNGAVRLCGRRIVFSHNTVRHAGRDLVAVHGLSESIVQYNDLSDAGWLTADLGMIYGHNTDFANTVFHHNYVHDNHAGYALGIYFDHLSHNAIVHHNMVWNVRDDPIRINNPSYGCLVFNNTCWKSGPVETFDHSNRNDLFDCRIYNNIFNKPLMLPDHVVQENNRIMPRPRFKDPTAYDFRIDRLADQDIGAFADGVWRAGYDPAGPPEPLPVYEPPRIPWMNLIHNACFELGSLESWQKFGDGGVELVPGNGWGNHVSKGAACPTGTSRYVLHFSGGRVGITQTVTGLRPQTTYSLSAWAQTSCHDVKVLLEVSEHGAAHSSVIFDSKEWCRRTLVFTTGPATTACIRLVKDSETGETWADNFTLPESSSGHA